VSRDATPALGTPGEPGPWRRAVEGAPVALARRAFGDARWSFLYGGDTRYAAERPGAAAPAPNAVERAGPVHGPLIKPAVWTWEVPLYFWCGGVAAGSSFVALAADLVGDGRSAAVARKVTLAAALPCAPLLISDLGRPERFLHMLRIFKLRSPMSVGAWCLMVFSNAAGLAAAADVLGRPRAGRALGAGSAILGTYLGSYTGALLASTAVPVWSRSRMLLGPIFVMTAAATGAATNRLVLAAAGLPPGHPTHAALANVETAAMASELALSSLNERRLGRFGEALREGRPGTLFRLAKWSARAGLALRLARGRAGPWTDHAASGLYLLAGLLFRYGWVGAGRNSARDDEAVAASARPATPRSA
jgi:hypothetical protein